MSVDPTDAGLEAILPTDNITINNNSIVGENDNDETATDFVWTERSVAVAIAVFVAAGFAEIGGGWLVWRAVRGNGGTKTSSSCCRSVSHINWSMAILGSVILVIYGFLPTLQPTNSFGRVYAVYGGFFIVLSILAGWALDGDRPDRGDCIGGLISLIGVLVILFWAR